MPRFVRLIAPLLLPLAVGCATSQADSDVHGAWRLESIQYDSSGSHVVGELLLLMPGEDAIITIEGRAPRRVPVKGFRGQDAFGTGEYFMLAFEGDADAFLVDRPTSNQMTLTSNSRHAAILTYRRAR